MGGLVGGSVGEWVSRRNRRSRWMDGWVGEREGGWVGGLGRLGSI